MTSFGARRGVLGSSGLLALALLAACAERTDLSYDDLLLEHRDEFGPFVQCGANSDACDPRGPGEAGLCLANAVGTCTPVEHVLLQDEGGPATTFVTPTSDGCEIIVFRDLGPGTLVVDYVRERCNAIELTNASSCIAHLDCEVEKRWNHQ